MAMKLECLPPVNKYEPEEDLSNGLYLIQNDVSGLYLSSTGDDPRVELRERSKDNLNQTWYLLNLGKYQWLIVNRASGLCLTSADDKTVAQSRLPVCENWSDEMQWLMSRDDAFPHLYIVRTSGHSRRLSFHGRGTLVIDTVTQFTGWRLNDDNKPNQMWNFVRVGDFRAEPEEQFHIATVNVHRMTSLAMPSSFATEETLVGRAQFPFPMIADPDRTPKQQSEAKSPFYMLRHYEYMRCMSYSRHSGAFEITAVQKIDLHIVGDNSMVERIIGIRIGTAGYFYIPGLTNHIFSNLIRPLKYSPGLTRAGATSTYQRSTQTVARGMWYREHRFELKRPDGSVVLEWTMFDPKYGVSDAYPRVPYIPGPYGIGLAA